MTAPPPPGYPPYPPPYPPHPGYGGPPLPAPFWAPVLLGAFVALAMSVLPGCAGPCCCVGANAWPGVFLAVLIRARRDPSMRSLDGGIMGFLVGGLAGAMRAGLVIGQVLPSAFAREAVQDSLDEMLKNKNFTTMPAEQQETLREGMQRAGELLGQYGDWMFAVALALGGMFVGILTWAMVRPRMWRTPMPPPPPPGYWPGMPPGGMPPGGMPPPPPPPPLPPAPPPPPPRT